MKPFKKPDNNSVIQSENCRNLESSSGSFQKNKKSIQFEKSNSSSIRKSTVDASKSTLFKINSYPEGSSDTVFTEKNTDIYQSKSKDSRKEQSPLINSEKKRKLDMINHMSMLSEPKPVEKFTNKNKK